MKVWREGRNPVALEVGGGGWGESSFPGGEGGGKPYTIYFFTLNKLFFICQINKNNLFFSCYEFIVFCLIIHKEPEPEPFYFEGSEPEPFFFEGSEPEPEPPKIGRLRNSDIWMLSIY